MIVGLSGYARCGKDTVADRLVMSHGFTKIGFADALKSAAYLLDPFMDDGDGGTRLSTLVDIHGWEKAKENPDVRRLLQRLGTEVGRNLFGQHFWVHQLAMRLEPDTNYVVPDCRFPNEAEFVQSTTSGQVWRIHRPGFAPVNPHSSETALDDWKHDTFISNDKTVAALHEHVDYLVEKMSGTT